MKAVPALILSLTVCAQAGPRSSASYSVSTDTVDRGGRRAASAAYTLDGSIGGVAGISTAPTPPETVKHGYLGQLFELATGVFLSATPMTIDEGGTRQIVAARYLDDLTGFPLDPLTVGWSVQSGPISINLGGIVSAPIVYQNEPATVRADVDSTTLLIGLTILNVNIDNFDTYASDGIDDAWQVQYFGLPPNALAGPVIDPDGDGQTNLFEYTAGLVPTDPLSRFSLRIAAVPGQPTQKRIIFSPRLSGRSYTVKFRLELTAGTWMPLTGATQNDAGSERTVTDLNATDPAKFYEVEITKP
jgi:hypothetical protein